MSPWKIFIIFLRIGSFTFGGGISMVGVMRHELVDRARVMNDEEFTDSFAFATAIPGAIAVNMGLALGAKLAGWLGALAGILGVVLPSFSIILLVVAFLGAGFSNPLVMKFFLGAAGAVCAQIAYSAFKLGSRVVSDIPALILALLGFAMLVLTPLHPLLVMLACLILRLLIPVNLKEKDAKKADPSRRDREDRDEESIP